VKATRDSHQFHPMPSKRCQIPFRRTFTEVEFRRLELGFAPETMEERWFVFMEDDWLCFVRSWTGFCIFQLKGRKNEPHEVVEAWANRDSEQYGNTDIDEDVELLAMLIDELIARGGNVKAFFVTERLAFGSGIKTWRHVEQLQKLGITHVIDLRFNRHAKIKAFKSLRLAFKDDKQPRPRWFYRKALGFYKNAMHQPGSKVFVMCRMGICRSASLTYFLLRSSRKSDPQAHALIIKARPSAAIGHAYRASAQAFISKLSRNKTRIESRIPTSPSSVTIHT
jgi:Dual specificity phosphatase, catalytic domain